MKNDDDLISENVSILMLNMIDFLTTKYQNCFNKPLLCKNRHSYSFRVIATMETLRHAVFQVGRMYIVQLSKMPKFRMISDIFQSTQTCKKFYSIKEFVLYFENLLFCIYYFFFSIFSFVLFTLCFDINSFNFTCDVWKLKIVNKYISNC